MRDICNFISKKEAALNISFVHFVYEIELKKLKQPFFLPNYYLYLSVNGRAVLKIGGGEYELSPGALFLVAPWQIHEIEAERDFTYLYISFNGPDVKDLLGSARISNDYFVASGFEHLIEFWMKSVRRIKPYNDFFLTCSVFMQTLSEISELTIGDKRGEDNTFKAVIQYIDEHYRENINLKMVADIFFYNEKYFSHLFKERMGVNFTGYLSEQRIRHALTLIDENVESVLKLSQMCGFSDSYYFSKVFKKHVGISPRIYIKKRKSKGSVN